MKLYFMEADVHMSRDITLISGVLIGSAILENTVNHVRYLNPGNVLNTGKKVFLIM